MSWAAVTAAVSTAAPYVAAASSVMSAFGTLQAGQRQSEMYKLQAQQAKLKASRDALQYEQQANTVYDRLLRNNATAAAKGFSGGVSGFSGSAKLIQDVNAKYAGKDIGVLQEGAKSAASFGEIQSMMLNEAADQAITGSYFDAMGKIGQAAYMYSTTATGSKAGATTASNASIDNVSSGVNLFKPVSSKYGIQI
jgi:hypothetical protein